MNIIWTQLIFYLEKLFFQLNNLDSALYYLLLAEKSDKIYVKTAAYNTLYNLEKRKSNYKDAYLYNEMYLQYSDSLYASLLSERVVEMEAKTNFLNLINIRERLKYQKAFQEQIYTYLLVSILFLFVGSYFIYQYIKRDREKKDYPH